jgi:hypothetical protein
MPIVISHCIEKLQPQFFWMGGGHPDVKMRIALMEFLQLNGGNYVLI